VDAAWKPVISLYQDAVLIVKQRVLEFNKKERDRIAKEQEEARLEAERAQEAAMEALMASSADDIWSEIDAANAVAEADKAAEKAAQLKNASLPMQVKADGIRARGVKLVWSADVIDAKAMTIALADHPAVQEAAAKIANGMARTMKEAFKLDGCKPKSTETL
jgi:methionyl-tRNA synthetase